MSDIMDKSEYRKRIPHIGMRFIVEEKDSAFLAKDCWAEVVAVNMEHIWYVVKYMGSGIRECFSPVRDSAYNDKRGREKKYAKS